MYGARQCLSLYQLALDSSRMISEACGVDLADVSNEVCETQGNVCKALLLSTSLCSEVSSLLQASASPTWMTCSPRRYDLECTSACISCWCYYSSVLQAPGAKIRRKTVRQTCKYCHAFRGEAHQNKVQASNIERYLLWKGCPSPGVAEQTSCFNTNQRLYSMWSLAYFKNVVDSFAQLDDCKLPCPLKRSWTQQESCES